MINFYKCNVCGNLDVEVFHGGGIRVCCEKEMILLAPNTTDAATEKHLPVITRAGDKLTVTVSSTLHPMEEKHWITNIVIVYDNKYQIAKLNPGEEPIASFDVPEAAKVTAYEYCNIHGLWSAGQ